MSSDQAFFTSSLVRRSRWVSFTRQRSGVQVSHRPPSNQLTLGSVAFGGGRVRREPRGCDRLSVRPDRRSRTTGGPGDGSPPHGSRLIAATSWRGVALGTHRLAGEGAAPDRVRATGARGPFGYVLVATTAADDRRASAISTRGCTAEIKMSTRDSEVCMCPRRDMCRTSLPAASSAWA